MAGVRTGGAYRCIMNKQALQDIHGVLLLDKPSGWGSTDALNRVKRLLGARKAGHGGTLDPMATGLLPLAFGQATRFSHESLEASKTYLARMLFGITTDSGDADGKLLEQKAVHLNEPALRTVVDGFLGDIEQVPPMFSALKRDGKPLYEYARAGETIEREARQVTIRSIELLGLEPVAGVAPGAPGSQQAHIRITCSKGTYIRTLAEDIGARLGCGAHLTGLRREAIGTLLLADAVTIEQLESMEPAVRLQCVRPAEMLISALPAVVLDDEHARRFLHGQRLRLAEQRVACEIEPLKRVRVYAGRQLIGTGTYDDGLLAPLRLIAQSA